MRDGNFKNGYDDLQKDGPVDRNIADAVAFGSSILDGYSSSLQFVGAKEMQKSASNFEDGQSLSFEPLPELRKNANYLEASKTGGAPVEMSQSLDELDSSQSRYQHHGHHQKRMEGIEDIADATGNGGGRKYLGNDSSDESLGYYSSLEMGGRQKAPYFLPADAALGDVPTYQKSAYRPVQFWERIAAAAATVFSPPWGLYMEADQAARDIQRIRNAGDPKDV